MVQRRTGDWDPSSPDGACVRYTCNITFPAGVEALRSSRLEVQNRIHLADCNQLTFMPDAICLSIPVLVKTDSQGVTGARWY